MGPYPTLILKNQQGEQSNNTILGGTSQLWCNFIVDSTNGNGLGIRSLKGSPQIAQVYMHTSATPAAGNPNPAAGYVLVQFNTAFAGYVNGTYGFDAPLSGSSINVTSGLTLGAVYVITALGTTTAAQWQALGLPTNVTPTVGQAFVAITASAGSGTGTVQQIAATGSGVSKLELVGDPNQSVPGTGGGWLLAVFLAPTSSSVTTAQPTAPANNTVVGLTFNMLPEPGPQI
jgi:hypothetical protein